ncbi:hypothetical protein NW752_002292 [Fusarium irregulare]|uniref:LysM domain-containing protein n=1 Tax=Fusarium irregulare TaxID=2494466 RepID=A0A9W8PFV3_9HYPO|nr:hypothetical protein NW766_011007 [Fusarium irregulare]KAJ4024840.1 hypothetical protein NW752_002292 [Fusarium irregulare]
MHLTTLLAASLLPVLPYARSIPSRRGVDCSFYTSPDSGATCATFAEPWGMSEDDLKALNPGIKCPNIDTEGSYCVLGSVTDGDDEPSSTAAGSKSTVPASTKMTSVIKTTATPVKPTVTQKPSTTKQPSGNGIKTPEPIQEGMVTNCNKFHYVSPTTSCQGILNYNKISLADFVKWNPAVGRECELLWAGTNACVGVIGATPSLTTTTKPKPVTTTIKGNGIKTPEPIQEGMVSNCNKWHFVGDTTTCQGIISYNKITLDDFVAWNPAVGKGCSHLWKGTHACVGVVGSNPKPKPTATAPSNGVKTPLPIQEGMVKNCVTFHYISSTTTCQALLKYRKITIDQFFKWNPAVKEDCSGLWKETNACVGVK